MSDWILNHVCSFSTPTVVVLLGIALATAFLAVRQQSVRAICVAGALTVAAICVFAADALVTTPGEHARAVVAQLVAAAEAGDPSAMRALIADDATIHYGGAAEPGYEFEEISRGLDSLRSRHRIESNRITRLSQRTEGDAGVVELSCWTETASMSGFGGAPTDWLLTVAEQPDRRWLITTLVWERVFREPPSRSIW